MPMSKPRSAAPGCRSEGGQTFKCTQHSRRGCPSWMTEFGAATRVLRGCAHPSKTAMGGAARVCFLPRTRMSQPLARG